MSNKEKVLTEAATSNQDKAKPLYENSNISVLIAQVLSQGVELIRLAGYGKRRFTIYYGGYFLNVYETDKTHQFVRDWVDVMIDDRKEDQVIEELSEAMDTMCKLLGEVREELGYGKE